MQVCEFQLLFNGMTDNHPLVSVLMPSYNHEAYVVEAIRSVLVQDYPRIEFVLIDDGSKDGTWKAAASLRQACESRFERVVMRVRENRGTAATCKELMSEARGEFVALLASDDQFEPGALSRLAGPMIEDPAVGLTVGRNLIMDGEGRMCYWDKDRNNVYDLSEATYTSFDEFIQFYTHVDFKSSQFGSYAELTKGNHVPNGQMIRREVYDLIDPYDSRAPLEDWWLQLQLSKVTRYRYVDAPTFRYRWHGTNTASNAEKMRRMGRATILRERERLLEKGDVEHLEMLRPNFMIVDDLREIKWLRRKGVSARLICIHGFDTVQYRLAWPGKNIKLTPKMRERTP